MHAVTLLSVACSIASHTPMLFMDMDDIEDGWGLIEPVASTVAPHHLLRPPPMPYHLGSLVIAVFPSTTSPGVFEVYGENTTGWEPLGSPGKVGGFHECALIRFTTWVLSHAHTHTHTHTPSLGE